jgi:hypothetical protein
MTARLEGNLAGGLLDEVEDADRSVIAASSDGGDTVEMDLFGIDLHERDDGAAGALVDH